VRRQAAAPALASRRLKLTNAELDARAWRLARQPRAEGVQPVERICILSQNDPEFLVLFIVAPWLRACVATLNPRLAPAEPRCCIHLVSPRAMMLSTHLQPRAGEPGLDAVPVVAQALVYLRQRRPQARSLMKPDALAGLYTRSDLAERTALLGQSSKNPFGRTESGMPPLAAGRLAPSVKPQDLAQLPTPLCEIILCDAEGRPVPAGAVGEQGMRSLTLFNGYRGAPEATAEGFRGGRCRRELAAFKRPKRVFHVDPGAPQRNGAGKIVRAKVEAWVAREPVAGEP
jgi:acyl-CoA synthetase (AMP-forming)/AMP-acid ligase II